MKKKILALALVVAMLAIAVASGSLAWFTDNDKTTNTFTVGSVKIQQNEDFTQNSQLLPIVNTEHPDQDPNYVKKIVSVTNQGKNDAYIRTFIAVPKALDNKLHLDTTGAPWVEQWVWHTVSVDNVDYIVHIFVNNDIQKAGYNSGDLLKGVYLDASVDVQENPGNNNRMEFCWKDDNGEWVFSGFAVEDATKVNVLVATQAVQAQGFANAQQALNDAFGKAEAIACLPDFYA